MQLSHSASQRCVLPAAAWYFTIICLSFIALGERNKRQTRNKEVPRCRRLRAPTALVLSSLFIQPQLNTLRDTESRAAWLAAIARNQCRQWLFRRCRDRAHLGDQSVDVSTDRCHFICEVNQAVWCSASTTRSSSGHLECSLVHSSTSFAASTSFAPPNHSISTGVCRCSRRFLDVRSVS